MSGIDSAFDDRQHEGLSEPGCGKLSNADSENIIKNGPGREVKMSSWIEWHGGEQPVPDGTKVEIMFRCGVTDTGDAEAWLWGHEGDNLDIVKYRVAKDDIGFLDIPDSRIENMKREVKEVLAKYRTPVQIEGSHYTDMIVEPLDLAVLNNLSPFEVKIVKYATRDKNGLKDIRKAIDMLNKKAMYFYGVNVLEEDNDC